MNEQSISKLPMFRTTFSRLEKAQVATARLKEQEKTTSKKVEGLWEPRS